MQRILVTPSAWLGLIVYAATAACSAAPSDPPETDSDSLSFPPTGLSASGLELLAGSLGGRGNADGTGGDAAFRLPTSVAVDGAGNVYVADTENNTIRKITPSGVVTTLAGVSEAQGSSDGVGSAARLFDPNGVAADAAGNVFVADSANCSIRKISPSGAVTTLAGSPGSFGSVDGVGAAASFNLPDGIAVDATGNIFVADTQNSTIRKITPAGIVTTLAGQAGQPGATDGTVSAARFNQPAGVAVDSAGNAFVADTQNSTIRKITPTGIVTTLAGLAGQADMADGTGATARFNQPTGLAIDRAGNVLVADRFNSAIRKITPTGIVTTLAGNLGNGGTRDGIASAARFSGPTGVAIDGTGNVFVADSFNNTIRKISPIGAVTTLAGTASQGGDSDGPGLNARFFTPVGLAADSHAVYVTDAATIRKITAPNLVSTIAGDEGFGSTDGPAADAEFFSPDGIATDATGNLVIADEGNNTVRTLSKRTVSTLAGTAGESGFTDGTGAAARFSSPAGVAIDATGNTFVADLGNAIIRKITPSGAVTTFAGTPHNSGTADGTGPDAQFFVLTTLAIDPAGNLYYADFGGDTVRKISPSGVVTTLAGSPRQAGSTDGTGADARFNQPSGVAVDATGNVFVADTGNSLIRKVTPGGVVTTIVGVPGVAGLQVGTQPRLAEPQSIAIVGDSLVITDNRAVLLLHHGAR